MRPPTSANGTSPRPSRGHVLITGASTGIGRSCALQLAWNGFTVWAGIRTPAEASAIEHSALGTPVPIRTIPLDVTDIASIRAAAATIRSDAGTDGLRGLVNNAGICVVGPVECIPLGDWRQQFEVNLLGTIAVTQVMLPLLRTHNGSSGWPRACIVNMGSISGDISTPLFGAYSASKFALRAMTDALRLELRADGIGVSLIVPGTIQSDIWRKEKEGMAAMAADSRVRQLYGSLIGAVAANVFRHADRALPAERVADLVERCLTSSNPRIQYRVGWEAQVGARAKRLMPDRLFDFLLRRNLGVQRQRGPGRSATLLDLVERALPGRLVRAAPQERRPVAEAPIADVVVAHLDHELRR
jgi:NAD(P)-dependent dehydrogenase (short-subunit alcohol dehydrogenase family)